MGRALDAGVPIERLVVAPDIASASALALIERAKALAEVTSVGPAVVSHLSRREHPDGILAVAVRRTFGLEDLVIGSRPLLLVAEGIEKPGNIGAMLRSAEAAGVDGVLAADPGTDLTNPHVIRASQGSVFAVPTAVCTAGEAVAYLDRHEIQLFALTPSGGTDLWETELTGPAAIAVGAEDVGLSPELRAAGRPVRVPMFGGADSLNASVAAAISLYEAVRQRRRLD